MANTRISGTLDLEEQVVLISALKNLIPDLSKMQLDKQKLYKRTDDARSAIKKLNKLETEFTASEMFVMYAAADYLRNMISDSIANREVSDSDREMAWSTRRTANQICKKLKLALISVGVDIDKEFGSGI